MTNYTGVTTDPIARAHAHLNEADVHASQARALRDEADDETLDYLSRTLHAKAGRCREEERMSLKRADVLATLALAEHTARLADAADRAALSL